MGLSKPVGTLHILAYLSVMTETYAIVSRTIHWSSHSTKTRQQTSTHKVPLKQA